MHLFGFVDTWPDESLPFIKELLLDIQDLRPQFKKSPPAALLSLSMRFPDLLWTRWTLFDQITRFFLAKTFCLP